MSRFRWYLLSGVPSFFTCSTHRIRRSGHVDWLPQRAPWRHTACGWICPARSNICINSYSARQFSFSCCAGQGACAQRAWGLDQHQNFRLHTRTALPGSQCHRKWCHWRAHSSHQRCVAWTVVVVLTGFNFCHHAGRFRASDGPQLKDLRIPTPLTQGTDSLEGSHASAGATGLIGNRLVRKLTAAGNTVLVLTRDSASALRTLRYPNVKVFPPADWKKAIAASDAVVNLAGEPIATRSAPPPLLRCVVRNGAIFTAVMCADGMTGSSSRSWSPALKPRPPSLTPSMPPLKTPDPRFVACECVGFSGADLEILAAH